MKKNLHIFSILAIVAFCLSACAKQVEVDNQIGNQIMSHMGEMVRQETEKAEDQVAQEKADAEKKAKEEAEAQAKKEQESTVAQMPKVEAIPGQHRDPNSAVVVIDPGHQLRGDSAKEPNGPGSSTMKARVTSGATGVATKVAEYVMNLNVSLKLKTELENRGYTVYMTRYTHDVNISNKERAEYATSVEADIAVRIHGNGSSNSSVRGAETYAPSAKNPYVSHLSKASISLSRCIIDAYCQATGFKNRGVFTSDTMTGINWSTVPVTIIELGYMSNAQEDRKMQDETIQNNMVQGIANGIDKYFGF
ncbi:MAG: N-acetylmuramoyl-L-alanine amidase [Tyzzerella sp.]|nr:N-acetylmuramoyl-L-alanine amidase [Tyzzerella sp.]